MSEQTQRICQLQRVYAQDISFEAPGAPEAFTQPWDPKMQVQLDNGYKPLGDGSDFEVTVTATVTASREEKTIYIAEATLAGIFTIQGLDDEELEQILSAYCPGVIFPYLRETVSATIMRGSFPQFLMRPVNFDAIYHDKKQRREQQESDGGQTH